MSGRFFDPVTGFPDVVIRLPQPVLAVGAEEEVLLQGGGVGFGRSPEVSFSRAALGGSHPGGGSRFQTIPYRCDDLFL